MAGTQETWHAEAIADPDPSAEIARLRAALAEIKTICNEDNATFRKRMGTRVGNILVVADAALKAGQQ